MSTAFCADIGITPMTTRANNVGIHFENMPDSIAPAKYTPAAPHASGCYTFPSSILGACRSSFRNV